MSAPSPPAPRFVQLLGPPAGGVGSERIGFADDKRYRLLAYLACSGDWVERERLAFLFWPDALSSAARQRLRQLLRRVRALGWTGGVESENARVRWPVESDVAAFRDALATGDLAAATRLYRGELLQGFRTDDASEFAAWLEFERAELHSGWRTLLLERAPRAADPADLLSPLEALLRHDDLDEEALRVAVATMARAGRRARALETYRRFARRLAETLGTEPAPVTRRLVDAIGRDASAPATVVPFAASRLAAREIDAESDFVGRDADLDSVRRLLAQPSCRLLTLVGFGGVGKSRIAERVVETWSDSNGSDSNGPGWGEHGARFVRLEALSRPSAIPAAIADALGIALHGERDPVEQLARAIDDRRLLLALDNYEHLIDGAPLTGRLLRECPRLTLLVTSRERLGVPAEWIFEVAGLDHPAADVPLERALAYDAVRLFVARTRQVRSGWEPSEADLPHLLAICRHLHGLPLGLELAAARTRGADLAAIAEEIAADVDFLRGRREAERHESLRAVFESSWRLLTSGERRALATLSVFRGGFTRQAAGVVADASTAVLGALVDKSLLELRPNGRYERHPLLYRYAREKLAARGDEAAALRRHARRFLTVAEEVGARLRVARDARDVDALEAEHDNLRAALGWTLEHEPTSALRMAGALGRFWEIRGHLVEGCEWLEAALEAARDPAPGVTGRALGALGRLLFLRGRKREAEPRYHAALERWRAAGDDLGVADALNRLGALALERGRYAEAEALYCEALELNRARADATGTGAQLNNLGEVARLRGDAALAERRYRECLAVWRPAGARRGCGIALGNLGTLLGLRGDAEGGAALLRESIEIKRDLGDAIGLAYCFSGLAAVLARAGAAVAGARLLGAAEALIDLHGVEFDVADRIVHREASERLRTALGARAFEEAREAGWALEPAAAVAEALAVDVPAGREERG